MFNLKEHIRIQADRMAQLQADLDKLLIASRYTKEQESKYIRRELDKLAKKDMNRQVVNLQENLE